MRKFVQTTGVVLWEREDIWMVTSETGLIAAVCVTFVFYVLAMVILVKTRFRPWMLAPAIAARRNWLMPWVAIRRKGGTSLRALHYSVLAWKTFAYLIFAGFVTSAALALYFASSDSIWGNFRQKPLALVSLGLYLLVALTLVLFWRANQWNLSFQLRVVGLVPFSLDLMDTASEHVWSSQDARERILRYIFVALVVLGLIFVTITNLFLIPFGECEGWEIAWMYTTCNTTLNSQTRAAHDNYMNDSTWHVSSNWIFILFNTLFVIITSYLIDLYVHAGVDLVVEVQTRIAQRLMRYGVNAHQTVMAAAASGEDANSLESGGMGSAFNERAPTAQERVDVLLNLKEHDDQENEPPNHDFDDYDDDDDDEDVRGDDHRNAHDHDNYYGEQYSNFAAADDDDDDDNNANNYYNSDGDEVGDSGAEDDRSDSAPRTESAARADLDALSEMKGPTRVPLSSPDGREMLDKEMSRAYEVLKNFVWKEMGQMPGLQRGEATTIETIARQDSLRWSGKASRPPARVIKPTRQESQQNYMETLLSSYMGILRAGIMLSYGASLTVLILHAVLHLILTQRTVAFFQAVGILMTDSILLLKFFESTKMRTRTQAGTKFARISRAQPWHVAMVSLLARIVLVSVPSNAWFIGQAFLFTVASIYLAKGLSSEYMSKNSTGWVGRRTALRALRRIRSPASLFRAAWLTGIVFLREILFAFFFFYFGCLTLLLSSPSVDNAMRLGAQENSSGYVTVWILNDAIPQYKIGVLALLIVCNFCAGFLAWQYWLRIRGRRPLHVLSNLRLATQVLATFAAVMALAIFSAHFISYEMFHRTARFSIVGTVASMLPVTFIIAYVHEIWVRDDFRFWHPLPRRVILPANPLPDDEHYTKLCNYAAKVKAARRLIWRRNATVSLGCVLVVLGFVAWGASLVYEVEDLDFEFAILFPCATFALLCGILGAELWFNTLQVSRGLVFLFVLLVANMLASYVVGLEEVITSKGTAYNDFLDVIGFFLLLVPVFISGAGAMLVFRDEHFKPTKFVLAAGITCCAILIGLGAWFILRFSQFAGIFYYLCLVIVFILSGIWLWWHSSRLDSDKRFRPTRRLLWIVVALVALLCALGAWDLGTEESVIIGDVADPLYGVSYFLVAYALALIFTIIYILSINRDLVRRSTRLSPSPSLLGLPAIAFKVENRGGELYRFNSPVLWVVGVLFSLQLLGFTITWTVQPNAGISMTSVALCILEIYALHMSVARSLHFRGNLLEIDDVSELDSVFERILRESVDRCLQISQQAMMTSWLRTGRPHLDETGDREEIPRPEGGARAMGRPRHSFLRGQSQLTELTSIPTNHGFVLRTTKSAPELPRVRDLEPAENHVNGPHRGGSPGGAELGSASAAAAVAGPANESDASEDGEIVLSTAKALVEYYKDVAECDAEYARYLHDGCKYDALFNVLFWMRTTQVLLEQRAAVRRVLWTPLASENGDSVSASSSNSAQSACGMKHANSAASRDDLGSVLDDTRRVIPRLSSANAHAERVPQLGNYAPARLPSLEVSALSSVSMHSDEAGKDARQPGQTRLGPASPPATPTPTTKALKFLKGARGSLRAASRRFSSAERNPAEDRNAGRLSLAQSISQRKGLITSQYERRGSYDHINIHQHHHHYHHQPRQAPELRHDSGLNLVLHAWKHLDDDAVLVQLESIIRRQERWEDGEFPATNASLFLDWNDEDYEEFLDDLDDDDIRGAVWCRPHEFLPQDVERALNRALCVKPAEDFYDPTEVLQGGTGDCWLLSAMSVVALFPALLDHVVVTKHIAEQGIYHVRLFLDGKWENILVDDRFPCSLEQSLEFDPNDESKTLRLSDRPPDIVLQRPEDSYNSNEVRRLPLPQYCRSRSGNVLWPMLVEKAYAKRFGSYEALNGGHVHSALVDLTGGLSQVFSLHDDVEVVMSGALWDKLLEFYKRGALLAAGSPAPQTDASSQFADGQLATDRNGIVHGHAYSIVRVVDESDYNGHHRLLQLRDPWGISRWNGPWSRKDRRRWTRRMQRRLGYEVDAASRVDGLREILTQMERDEDANEDPIGSLPTGFESDNASRPFGSRDEGDFWISLEEFVARFQWLYVCQIFDSRKWAHRSISDEWKGLTAGGPPNQPGARFNPQYGFRLQEMAPRKLAPHRALNCRESKEETVTVFFSISNLQESQASRYQSSNPAHATRESVSSQPAGVDPFGQYEDAARESGRIYPFMSLLLLDIGGKRLSGDLAAKSVVASTGKYKDSRDLSFEIKLPCRSDVTYTIFPSLFPRGKEGAFRINIYCETGFELFRLPLAETDIV